MRDYRQQLERRKGQLEQTEQMLTDARASLADLEEQRLDIEEAQLLITEVAQETQQQLEFHIANLVSLALAAVFDDPYELKIEFVQRRNQTEADISFWRNGNKIEDPLNGAGGGACDVAGFGLRVALWSLKKPRTRPVLILDEPFPRLKGAKANLRALEMVKSVAERLGLQVLMISDERVPLEDIIATADNVVRIGIKEGVSYVVA